MVFGQAVEAQEFGVDCGTGWESSGDTSRVLYTYPKYWDDGGVCGEINESWSDSGCAPGYDYCVTGQDTKYEVHAKKRLASPNSIMMVDDGETVFYRPLWLEDSRGVLSRAGNAVGIIDDNVLVYDGLFGVGGDRFVLTSLADMVKEEVVLTTPIRGVSGNLTLVSQVVTSLEWDNRQRSSKNTIPFWRNGRKILEITRPEASSTASYAVSAEQTGVSVDYHEYDAWPEPLIIDPTTLLDFGSIVEDARYGEINKTPPLYTKNSGGSELRAGTGENAGGNAVTWRSASDLNLTSLPDGVTITNVTYGFFILDVDDDNTNLNVTKTNFHSYETPNADASIMGALLSNPFGGIDNLVANTQRNISFNGTGIELVQEAYETDPVQVFTHGIINGEDTITGQDNDFTDIASENHANANARPRYYVTYSWTPLLDNNTASPPSPANYSEFRSVTFNVTAYLHEDSTVTIDTVLLNINGTNYSASNLFGEVYNVTLPFTTFGNVTASHEYSWFANESGEALANTTQTFSYNITQNVTEPPPDTPPTYHNLSETPPSPQNWSANLTVMFNITVLDDVGVDTVLLNINGTNLSASNLFGNTYNVTVTNSTFERSDNYTFSWFMNDTGGQANMTPEFVYIFEDFPESDWELAVLMSLFGSASLIIWAGSHTHKRHEPIRVLSRLTAYLLIATGFWAGMHISQESSIINVTETAFQTGMIIMVFILAYEMVNVLWFAMAGDKR